MRLLAAWVLWAAVQEKPPEIRVVEGDWGGASRGDIRKVLESTAAQLTPLFPGRVWAPIEVSRGRESPITLYRRGPKGEILVRLNVEGTHWAQFAFQFAHELGHILCRYEDHEEKENKWLEETLCETASLFALRRMGRAWKEKPPYPNWKDYAGALTEYAEERIEKHKLPAGTALPAWFRESEPAMRANAELRDKNTVVAAQLLALFEEDPSRWQAVATLPSGKSKAPRSFAQYLKDWKASTPEKHRPLIDAVAAKCGVSLDQ